LRFSRDKRGYEHTFVIHSDRRRGRSRTRILYWFRTPPGVKVGRSALDETAIRSIEESNPDIEFDWTRILKEQAAPEPNAPNQRPPALDRRSSRRPSEPRGQRPPSQVAPPPHEPVVGTEPTPEPGEPPALPETLSPATEEPLPIEAAATVVEETLTPAHARLGAEGVLRLRARHAEILARISERVPDRARQDELKAQADRLNPDTWVTDEEVRAGLEGYESVLESLRAVVGQGRRRRRGGGQPREGSRAVAESSSSDVPGTASEPGPPAADAGGEDDDAEPGEEPV
jgi:hypothetical protein